MTNGQCNGQWTTNNLVDFGAEPSAIFHSFCFGKDLIDSSISEVVSLV